LGNIYLKKKLKKKLIKKLIDNYILQMTTTTNQESMKTAYKAFIKENDLFATYMNAVNEKKKWENDGHDSATNTNGVNPKRQLKIFTKKTQRVFEKPVKIKIDEVLGNNMCFWNSTFLEEKYGWKSVVGYNITACACGGLNCLELHSVNRKDGELVDFTKDFDGEKSKWFIELKDQSKKGEEIARAFNRSMDCFNWGRDKCKCGINWNFHHQKSIDDLDDFVAEIEQMNKITIMYN
jgi:hypothetical protein